MEENNIVNISISNTTKRITRKKKKFSPLNSKEYKDIWKWDEFLIEGDRLYNYLITNFNLMIIGDKITNFAIIDGIYSNIKDTEDMTEKIGDDIEKMLIPWIKKEYKENRLFDKTLWKPFRDMSTFIYMHYGYRKLFLYDKYIFQLGIVEEFDIVNNIRINERGEFVLALYGWKKDNSNMLQPYKKNVIPEDNLMSELHWNYQ
jgi:hypothetical protein